MPRRRASGADGCLCDGAQALRYADAREAGIHPARSRSRAHVCVRADGLRLRAYRQCAPGHRVRRAVSPVAAHIRREHVTYVRNITDVDDKINARAAERGISIRQLTEETYTNFKADVAALGCLPPTVEPRATEHIEQMKALIERLVAGGHAYVAEDNVLFNVPSMPDYGQLSKRPLDEMIAGARVEVAPYKERSAGFRAVEAVKAGRAGMGLARRHQGAGPPGLAHRMLGDGLEASGRDLRHPRRRHRPRLSAPRERNRAIALRVSYPGDGELLDAQRLLAGRRREDGEVGGKFCDHP